MWRSRKKCNFQGHSILYCLSTKENQDIASGIPGPSFAIYVLTDSSRTI